jgi:hypothetical protein
VGEMTYWLKICWWRLAVMETTFSTWMHLAAVLQINDLNVLNEDGDPIQINLLHSWIKHFKVGCGSVSVLSKSRELSIFVSGSVRMRTRSAIEPRGHAHILNVPVPVNVYCTYISHFTVW